MRIHPPSWRQLLGLWLGCLVLLLAVQPTWAADPVAASESPRTLAAAPRPPLSKARLEPMVLVRRQMLAWARSVPVRGRMADVDLDTSPAVNAARLAGDKWIEVDLSEQRVYAYEGTRRVRTFVVSTGVARTPTVTGEFRIWIRTPLQDMSGGNRAAGDYYYLEDVPWVQYFYQEYAFHGTYWHNNFGQPMSRGCVNMTIEDAKWLFDWAFPEWDGSPGWFRPTQENATLVVVHE